jgi:arylsulfatase A-like enzyme
VPFITWWPTHVPTARVCEEFITALDVLPSFAHITGASLPQGHALDGFDVSDVWLGRKDARSPRTTLYSLYGLNKKRLESLRSDHWKLHLLESPALYDLGSDPAESRDVSSEHPDIVRSLSRIAKEIRKTTGIPEPAP